ncbi:MAG: hypothetical protein B7C24_15945 [Bacteroidetes bacterium 4572_77]|nr:MAG: hypothetical protein B7C24_15945 [Bacteroidetes bacterium 4572_77]
MKPLFKDMSISEFDNHFSSEEACLAYLSEQKWQQGFICKKCGHNNSCAGKKAYARRCTKCKHQESATAHTVFHRCKIPLNEAFRLTFLVCQNPNISSHEISRIIDIRQMTCWKFKKKITECINDRGDIDLLKKLELQKKINE